MEKENNYVECFMYYMYNKWCLDEARHLFGEMLGDHIYGKWLHKADTHDQTMSWYGELDKSCRDKIYDRAIEIYK